MNDRTPKLDWPGKTARRPEPVPALSTVASGDDRATLITGDNLSALQALTACCRGTVSLAYLDPPFLTGRKHERVTRQRDPDTGRIQRQHHPAFDDRWEGLDHYLAELLPRVSAARDLLAPHGCLVLHVDSKTSHYAKVLCDEVFGPRAFASEIVWRYRRWPSKTRNFQRVHDVLLRYVKDPKATPRFHQLYEPLAASTRATWGDRRQRAVLADDGRRARSSTTVEASPGAPLGDVWDIGIVAPVSRERTGYPTQKPELLLERLVSACTDPGDVVLDPYVGSGTSASVAIRLGRRILAIDINPDAIEITRRRLATLSVKPHQQTIELGGKKAPAAARPPLLRARPLARGRRAPLPAA